MKNYGGRIFLTVFVTALFMLFGSVLWAEGADIPTERIKNAFRLVLDGADKNRDGNLSTQECRAMSASKEMEKNCRYWDANGDGIITEDEYVQQAKKIGKKR